MSEKWTVGEFAIQTSTESATQLLLPCALSRNTWLVLILWTRGEVQRLPTRTYALAIQDDLIERYRMPEKKNEQD